jgi:hypothetical protein
MCRLYLFVCLFVCLFGTQADRQAESWQRLPFFQNKGFTMRHKRAQAQFLEDGVEKLG